jgi:hypothetical protein
MLRQRAEGRGQKLLLALCSLPSALGYYGTPTLKITVPLALDSI